MIQSIPFFKKFMLCLLLALLLASTVLLLGSDIGRLTSPIIIFAMAAIAFMLPLAALPVWEYRSRKSPGTGAAPVERILNLTAYLCGVSVSVFGWRKLLGMQFRTPLSIADLPMSIQDGEALTWFYFGHSVVFGAIIAAIQITGSLLLFFKNTRLAGVLLLLPVMLNIMLLNFFYNLNAGALLQSFILTVGLFCLLFQYNGPIRQFFSARFKTAAAIKSKDVFIAVALLLTSFVFTYLFKPAAEPELYGAYKVTKITINGTNSKTTLERLQDSVLTKVYFDLDKVCVLEYNSDKKRLIAGYNYDKATRLLRSSFTIAAKPMLLAVSVSNETNGQVKLSGNFGTEPVEISLVKTR